MKIFLDTADVDTIKNLNETGLIDGVTTNPTLIRKSGANPDDIYSAIADLGVPDISMEVYGDAQQMYDEAMRLSDTYGNVATIKLPMTNDGLQVCRELHKERIRTNVSPFVGRLDDQQVAGLEVLRGIAGLYQIKRVETQVLAASIRTVQRAVRSFYNGADIVTMPPEIFTKMYDHVLTDVGLSIFDGDIASIESKV